MGFASFLSGGFIIYCHSSKFTGKETGKTHLCGVKVLKKIRTFTHLCFVEAHLLICEAVNYSEISEKTRENSYVQNNNAP